MENCYRIIIAHNYTDAARKMSAGNLLNIGNKFNKKFGYMSSAK